jgi:diguanylate cyclase (GGDEF)-like protein
MLPDKTKIAFAENDHSEKIELLKKSEIFSSLDITDIEIVAQHAAICILPVDALLFSEGDAGDAIFIVADGTITISKSEQFGDSTVIAELITGDSFGELEFLTNTPRTAAARATAASRILRFPAHNETLDTAMKDHTAVYARILQMFIRVMAGRIRNANALVKENSPWVQELRRQVYGDKLTGLYNKTYLEEELPSLLKDQSDPVSLFLMKPDNFKYINDTYGHEAGDDLLKLMASELNRHVDGSGICIKYMGNELGVVLPHAGRDHALEKATGIRTMFNNLDTRQLTGGTQVQITVSIGIAVFPEHSAASETIISLAHDLPLVGRARGGNLILFPEDNK